MTRQNRTTTLLLVIGLVLTMLSVSAYAVEFDAEKTYESVFVVYSGNQVGSGFAIAKNCVITNAHVLSEGSSTSILSYHGENYEADVSAVDIQRDIAVLEIIDGVFEPLPLGDVSECNIGDDVFAIGAPNNLPYTLTKGIISSKNRVVADQSYIQIDAAINHGNSGGPLLTSDGKVIGINSMTFRGSEGLSLAIPIGVVFSVLDENSLSIDSGSLETHEIPDASQEGNTEIEDDSETSESSASETFPNTEFPNSDQSNSFLPSLQKYLVIALCGIVALSAVIILLVYRSNRKKKAKIDITERTDFDIDILG